MELIVTMVRVLWDLDFRLAFGNSSSESVESPRNFLNRYPEHSKDEYHFRDRFTSWKDGPMLEFRARDVF